MVEILRLRTSVPNRYIKSLRRKRLNADHYDRLISKEDIDIYLYGKLFLSFRHNVLPVDVCHRAIPALRRAVRPSRNRGDAAGMRYHQIKQDGTRSKTFESPEVPSGTIGYLNGSVCRTTAYTSEDVRGWTDVMPFITAISHAYQQTCPDRYAAQMAAVKQTYSDWIIPNTVFSTVTVNRNFLTLGHTDPGDLPEGFAAMSVIRQGNYDGCYLVFPKIEIAIDMDTTNVLFADVHQLHGNTEIDFGVDDERISTVLYFRSGLIKCGTKTEEAERAMPNKRRLPKQ